MADEYQDDYESPEPEEIDADNVRMNNVKPNPRPQPLTHLPPTGKAIRASPYAPNLHQVNTIATPLKNEENQPRISLDSLPQDAVPVKHKHLSSVTSKKEINKSYTSSMSLGCKKG